MIEVELFLKLRFPNGDISDETAKILSKPDIYPYNNIFNELLKFEKEILSQKIYKDCEVCCKGCRFLDNGQN